MSRIATLVCVAALTILAWAYLLHLDRQMAESMAYHQSMADMGMPVDAPWTRADLLFAFGMWAVMMVGMMTPSAAPVLLVVAKSGAARAERNAAAVPLVFGAGYFVVWTGFSLAAALAQWWLHDAAVLSPAMAVQSSRVAAVILIIAGAYQLTPLKRACLIHCQSPINFLMTHWKGGLAGAFRMGLHHGTYCLGCCWALMLVLFAVGIMNLAWVAGIAVFVLIEKTGIGGVVLSRLAAAGLIVGALVLLLRS